MPLPKHEQKHSYVADLPSGTKVKYRPWIVREEQEYMYSTEGLEDKDEMLKHIEELIGKCIQDKTKIESLSEVDFLALCVEVRKKSKGEQHEIVFTCPHCGNINDDTFINLEEDVVSTPMITDPIEIGDSEYTFKDPSRTVVEKIKNLEKKAERNITYLINCLSAVTTPEQTYTKFSEKEAREFFETMDPKEFKQLTKEFAKILPSFAVRRVLACDKCGKETVVYIDSVTDFFV